MLASAFFFFVVFRFFFKVVVFDASSLFVGRVMSSGQSFVVVADAVGVYSSLFSTTKISESADVLLSIN
ncbi:hypothetical protein D3C80_2134040 [compost metagenome]